MNAELREAVGRMCTPLDESRLSGATAKEDARCMAIIAQALRDQEVEIATLIKLLADCFRMSGADPDGDDDRRLADYALRAVTDLRRDYDDVLDWQTKCEKAEALLRECHEALGRRTDPDDDMDLAFRITAHLGGENNG